MKLIKKEIHDNIFTQTRACVDDKIWDQVRNRVRNQVWNQIDNQVWNQIDNQVWNPIKVKLYEIT